MYDIIVIGSGIVGACVVHYLMPYNLKILLLEKNNEVASGVTKANSAIIHPGYDPKPGTLKARLNVEGNKLYDELTKTLNIPFKRTGSLTVALNDEEEKELYILHERGKINGVETHLITGDEARKLEPNLSVNIRMALYAPTTGILAPWDVVFAILENAIVNGLELRLNNEVKSIKKENGLFKVTTNQGEYMSKYVINAAGLQAINITRMVSTPDYEMIYTRGQYYVLDRDTNFVDRVIYPTPTKLGKGILIVPTIHGNILLGPTSETVPSDKNDEVTKDGLKQVKDYVNKMANNVPYEYVIREFSGIRPKTNYGDFIIRELVDVPGFIELAGIESPGLSAAPAIGKMVRDMILEKLDVKLRDNYHIKPFKRQMIMEKTQEEINKLVKQNPKYGKIICRCEHITEGEIIDAIHSPLKINTIDGIKRYLRPGAGRCQGGFCQALVLDIIARETGMRKLDILLNNPGSNILLAEKGGTNND